MNNTIAYLENTILKYNALDMLKAILYESFWNPENLVNVEILGNTIINKGLVRGKYDYSESGHNRLIRYSREIKLNHLKHFRDTIENNEFSEKEFSKFYIEMVAVLKHQLLRGEVYIQQSIEVAKELYSALDEEFRIIYGFCFQDVLRIFIWLYRHYKNLCEDYPLDNTEKKDIPQIPFEIDINRLKARFGEDIVEKIISKFGTTLDSENEQQNSSQIANLLLMFPIVKIKDKIIIPTIRTFIHNLFKFFHFDFVSDVPLVADKDQNKLIKEKYNKLRGELLEKLTMRYLGRLFKEENIYQSLKYGRDNEADITVAEKQNIILAECKGKILTLQANQGNYAKIERDFCMAIQDAYKQASRTERAILDEETFRDETGYAFQFSKPQNIYKLCITLDTFGNLSTQLQFLLKKDQEHYPLACNIFDLDIITRECINKDEFFEYLEMRSKEHDSNNSVDELDYFMQFKMRKRMEENQFSETDLIVDTFCKMVSSNGNKPIVVGYANELDKKYETVSMDYLLSCDL
ncbi:hypothetical protein ACFVR2_07420 [Gottfriedia sp. NPDC057991]|uniref:hypothetical protein n=1 Tax=Gottfriedia sp. NPDC057991 TaxID=3346298 RepID=UPI0036D80EE1